jgi:ubiquinone biosynthesis protein
MSDKKKKTENTEVMEAADAVVAEEAAEAEAAAAAADGAETADTAEAADTADAPEAGEAAETGEATDDTNAAEPEEATDAAGDEGAGGAADSAGADEKKNKLRKRSKEELHREFKERRERLVHSTTDLSAKLKGLLAKEIEQLNKRDKTRGVEIMSVFARHNFYANGFSPEELVTTLEDLGPTYVKIGQIMSSRVDIFPESYCHELEKLRQTVKPLDAEVARAVIEQETGRSIDDIFEEFRDEPLGSASIGQAHYGVLKDGTRVVTKVQRPLIADMMRKDFVMLKKLAGLINVVTGDEDGEDEILDLSSVIEELEKVTEEELDFRIEAERTRFFRENCIEDENVLSCPQVIDELTTERIFTMTFVDGYSVSKRDRLIEDGYDPEKIGQVLIENYAHQVLDVGTFHADPHQGNIMVSNGVPYWIDFGMVGQISDADVNNIQSLILSMLGADLEGLTNAVTALANTSPKTNRNKLMEDVDVLINKYSNVTSVNDLDMSMLLDEVTAVAGNNHMSLPGRFTMLARSIATIEGVIEQLCPELNLFKLFSDKFMDRAKKNFDLSESLLSIGQDALELGKKTIRLPKLAADALNSIVKGRMKINLELTGYEELVDRAGACVKNIILAVFACVLFLGSCLLCTTDIQPQTEQGIPFIAAAGLIFSVSLGIYSVKHMTKKK